MPLGSERWPRELREALPKTLTPAGVLIPLIERSEGRFLYNPSYIDQAAMIWKVDSSENEFVTLANPKFIPDLNVSSYLEKLRYKERNILKIALESNIWMEVERDYDTPYPVVGNRVTLSGAPFPEGNYALKDDNRMLTI